MHSGGLFRERDAPCNQLRAQGNRGDGLYTGCFQEPVGWLSTCLAKKVGCKFAAMPVPRFPSQNCGQAVERAEEPTARSWACSGENGQKAAVHGRSNSFAKTDQSGMTGYHVIRCDKVPQKCCHRVLFVQPGSSAARLRSSIASMRIFLRPGSG